MKKLIVLLKNRQGEGYIDTVLNAMILIMLVVLTINVFSFFTTKQDMDYFARELVEAAAVSGSIDSNETYNRYDELYNEIGFYPICYWTASYYDGYYGRVQYGETIRITISHTRYLDGFGIFRIPVTMTATYSALSQVYWK